jgi:hypothetical protein
MNTTQQQYLDSIREETERSVRTTMGEPAYDAYRKQPAANWLRQLSPDPKN